MAKMELLREPPKCFRVAQEEKPARKQRPADPAHDVTRFVGREVHKNVSTEDDVAGERLPEQRVFIDEVTLSKVTIFWIAGASTKS